MKMTAKEYLSQIETLEMKIEQRRSEAEGVREAIMSAGGIDYSRERVQTSPTSDNMSNAVMKWIELENELNKLTDKLIKARHEIIDKIQQLSKPKYTNFLYKRYVQKKSLELISVEMNYTYDYTRELHLEALKVFEETHKDLSDFKFSPHNPT